MDYLVAQDLIRSEHLDLVREGGLNGFKPFETTCGAATEPLIRLSPAEPLTLDDFAGYRELDRFDFDEAVADCHFGRYDGGRLFYMTAPGQRPVLFAKADGAPHRPQPAQHRHPLVGNRPLGPRRSLPG